MKTSAALESSEVQAGKSKKIRRFIIALVIFSAILLTLYLLLRGSLGFDGEADIEATVVPSEAWSRDIATEGYLDGAPIGGLGAGSVTWRLDGNFYNGRLDIGRNDMEVDENCGFYMYQKPSGSEAVATRLDADSLGPNQAKYYSLFPKSWVDYYGSSFTCKAKVTQFSPVIPGDYKLSSYPAGLYKWEITNPTDKPCEVSIMLTWENDFGGKAVIPATDEDGMLTGIRLVNLEPEAASADSQGTGATDGASTDSQGVVAPGGAGTSIGAGTSVGAGTSDRTVPDKDDCEFSIGSKKTKGMTVSYASAADISELARDFSIDGALSNETSADRTGAICVQAKLRPGQILQFPMVLTWDMPIVKGFTENDWYREYTRHYGRTGTNSWSIAEDALENADVWEELIDSWQEGILSNTTYPEWLKTSLFNELYYYVVGGTIWEAGAASGQADDPEEDMFGSLECYEFPYYGTSDVRFYGSWALLELWPEIEKQCVRQFCDSVYTTRTDRPKPLGTTAHDFGMYGNAFKKWNGYNYRDSRQWKDLNTKLVLMVYRDWAATGKSDAEFLEYCWIPVQKAMEKVNSQNVDGGGLPDSNGIDQTYDNMSMTGDTAYCGGLYLAACEAAREIALAMGDEKLADTYDEWLKEGQKTFEARLWNGNYYNIDTGSEDPSRIMSDQLCGQWYAVACGLPGIVPEDNAERAFLKIYDYNYKKFDGGAHGVVNVMLASGMIDTESSQSSECWVGTSWGVVAGILQQGMTEQAEEIGLSLYNTIWDEGQLWFRTPEAWQTDLTQVRSPYYMRATAVWAVKQAYDARKGQSETQ